MTVTVVRRKPAFSARRIVRICASQDFLLDRVQGIRIEAKTFGRCSAFNSVGAPNFRRTVSRGCACRPRSETNAVLRYRPKIDNPAPGSAPESRQKKPARRGESWGSEARTVRAAQNVTRCIGSLRCIEGTLGMRGSTTNRYGIIVQTSAKDKRSSFAKIGTDKSR